MDRIVTRAEAASFLKEHPVTPAKWSALIPAAGRGSRLGFHRPKLLYPILGKTILEWLLESLAEVCSEFVFVVSPGGHDEIAGFIKSESRINQDACRLVVQEEPTGMADAIYLAREAVRTPFVVVVWGDQVTLQAGTVAGCAALHEHRASPVLTFPTVLKEEPYIHFSRAADGRLEKVYQAREEKIPVKIGENDCGLFLFSAPALFDELHRRRSAPADRGRSTGESNLLPLLPEFDREPGQVVTLRIEDLNETLGVNTPEEVVQVETILRSRNPEGAPGKK